jgi:hypothetical protein
MEWRTSLFHALRHGAVCIINFTTMTALKAMKIAWNIGLD